ncbi:voltage-gated potassium channel subunit beta [Sphaeroforma arctica JP610]|uniref:Voltage-gated potassium channel subunit beta n=1 Tax=Sphaeroforma arctica JP610 TaxID=667725 RepID=A0A0L0G4T9_9EUKA|nr:voltage-gated potassium channel subunit beta [Sphaeroforma arctica JP610]KNC83273.1 voltage-gated potassium channel subunit beta [Sphaeroforma arctica JP610]|eukprot:XP_014157175.1 voltage-gated potassium channel subunit beta [Sphaeroforma arctica JP610]
MKYNNLGNSGILVSELSFGSWVTFGNTTDSTLAFDLMKKAYEGGINMFDNAEGYTAGSSETVMGDAVQQGIEEGVWERSDLVLTTKIFFGIKAGPNARGCSRKHIVEGTQAALKRMKLDYFDLVFCHRPDPRTPIEETVRAMNHIIDKGWAFYWGTSEWDATQITKACEVADRLGLIRPVMDQVQYNMFHRDKVERDYQPLYNDYGYGLTIWSPLASGILTGKYSGNNVPEGSRLAQEEYKWLKDSKFVKQADQITRTDNLKPIAEEIGCSLAQLAIAWCVANPKVSTTILGATSVKQLDQNLAALDYVEKLTPDVMTRIEEIIKSKPAVDEIYVQTTGLRSGPNY